MVRSLAPLVYYDRVDGTYIKVDTGSWQQWLNKNSRFRYESFWGSFTAFKEHRGEKIVWLAYQCDKEQPQRAYLGTSKDLTLDNLIDTAKELNAVKTSCWERKIQKKESCETFSNESEAIPNEIETNAVRLWCIFYTHPDGRVEFRGGCWEKEQALTRIQNLLKADRASESVGKLTDGTSGRYEVRQELVLPMGYTQKCETNSFDTKATSSKAELLAQVSELRHQLSELQKQLDQQRRLNSNSDAAVKFLWN